VRRGRAEARLTDIDFGTLWRLRRRDALKGASLTCDVNVRATLWGAVPVAPGAPF